MTSNRKFLLNRLISSESLIREALCIINKLSNYLTLFVLDSDKKLVGTVTDGDIRRGMLDGHDLDTSISMVMNKKFNYCFEGDLSVERIQAVKKIKINLLPILNKKGEIEHLINLDKTKSVLPICAFLLAGGMGKRLLPITESVPKPLVRIKGKAIIDYNIERLISFGIKNIFISINYLGDKIIEHIAKQNYDNTNIVFVKENEPLGTAGSIGLVDSFSSKEVLVMNSDLLCTIDFESFYLNYRESLADISIATVPYSISIPYAVLNTENYNVRSLEEKPTFTYYSNAGIYLIKQSIISGIKKNKYLDMTDFIELIIARGDKVISYPIRNYWQDIGSHKDLLKASQDVEYLKF